MKKQKKQTKKGAILLIIIAIIAILFSACCKDKEGEFIQKEIQISGKIKGVIIEGPWEVVITQNSEINSAFIEYNVPNKKITAELRPNGYLFIKASSLSNYRNKKLKANINATALDNIEGSGATAIYTYGQFSTSADISLSGASQIDGFLCEGDYVKIILSGASKLKNCTFKGNYLDATLSGASNATFHSIEVSRCKVNASGASHFNGSGYAEEASFTGSGSSSFKTFDLESENLYIDLSGASSADVTVNHKITGTLAGASILKYKKAENVHDVFVSGGAKIIRVD